MVGPWENDCQILNPSGKNSLGPSGPDLDGVVGEAGGEGLEAGGGVIADLGQLPAVGVGQGGHYLQIEIRN